MTPKTLQDIYDFIDATENPLDIILSLSNKSNCIYGIDLECIFRGQEEAIYWSDNLDLLSPLFSLAPETFITVVFTDGDYYVDIEPSNIATLIKDMHLFDDMKYNIDWYIDGVYL